MDLNAQKEKFSDAYLQAVVAVAGFGLAKPEPDDDSVDWIVMSGNPSGLRRRPQLAVQLKCTAQAVTQGTMLRFPLDVKNYDDLRILDALVPRLLVIVFVPDVLDAWLFQTEGELTMRYCGYWLNLQGYPDTSNETSVTVEVPRSQMFTPGTLRNMMHRINETRSL